MKIKLFTISNLLTLSNLLCGMIATVAILTDGDLHLAFWLLVLATLLLLLWPRRVTLDGLNSPHAILLRADSGEVLAEKDADSTIYPASMTKMMTALLAIEANPDLDTPVTLPEEIFPALQAQNASLAGFQPGETATVRDLLYGAMLPSGAECCEALAREVSGLSLIHI